MLNSNERSIVGSATSSSALDEQNIVFVTVSVNLPKMVSEITVAMKQVVVQRLIFVSSMGIYGEVEASELDYTILRPGWFDNGSDIEYQITQKGEMFYGHDISRKAIATFVKKMID